jgi:hypothetical protein
VAPLLLPVAALCVGFDVAGAQEAGPDLARAGASPAEAGIDAAGLAAHVRFLSDDLLGGRGAGSTGYEIAARYVAAQFERLGLRPAGPDGSWFQPFEVVGITTRVPASARVRGPEGGLDLTAGEDLVVVAGRQASHAGVEDAEIVFVGYGITAPEQRWDDFDDADVRGKVLLVLNNDPAGDPDLFAGDTRLYYGRWDYKYAEAARRGAAGAIIVHTTPSAGYPFSVVQGSWGGEQFELPEGGEPRLELRMWTTEDASRRIAALGGHDLDDLRRRAESRDFRPVPLGVTLDLAVEADLRRLETANVLGLLPGADSALAGEIVVYSAHLDHLGIGEADAEGDSIFNGARDNALGVAALLETAEAFAAQPPRRSVLFAALAAEEAGLLGSGKLAADPPRPAGWLAANLNLDDGNIWGRTRDFPIVGLGKSTLDATVREVARAQGREVTGDPFPDRGYFYRSDQFNFAKIGVPAIFPWTGVDFVGRPEGWGREQREAWEGSLYHRPGDEMDGWDLSGAVEDARAVYRIGRIVANADAMPAWTPGDEFEAARERALAERRAAEGGAAEGRAR